MEAFYFLFLAIGSLIVGSILGYFARQSIARKQIGSIEAQLQSKIEEAKHKEQEILATAKAKATQIIERLKKEQAERQAQLLKIEEGLLRKEETLEKRLAQYEQDKFDLNLKIEKVSGLKAELDELKEKELKTLEKISNLSAEEAKEELLKKIEKDYSQEIAASIKKLEQERKEELESRAREIMTVAIQRYARAHVSDITTTIVDISSDDIKGKIIGREGRNIKTLERLTGVEIVIDDTPGSITLSSFDPVRREIAKLALEKLIADGRIQPARIEEKVREAEEEIQSSCRLGKMPLMNLAFSIYQSQFCSFWAD